MNKKDILTQDEVIEKGIEFEGDVTYSGIYGQQVYNKPMEDGGEAINCILYEKYPNSQIQYYCYYKDGFPHGQSVTFYESGNLNSFCIMREGVIDGEYIEWYENGNIKTEENCMYGVKVSYKIWSIEGDLIEEKTEPTSFEQQLIERYQNLEAEDH